MTDHSLTRVAVNGVKLDVPTYLDQETTKAIAQDVTNALQAIEASSDRIDTHRFALEVCMKFATDLARERERASGTQDELGLQLASVNTSVESLIKLLE